MILFDEGSVGGVNGVMTFIIYGKSVFNGSSRDVLTAAKRAIEKLNERAAGREPRTETAPQWLIEVTPAPVHVDPPEKRRAKFEINEQE